MGKERKEKEMEEKEKEMKGERVRTSEGKGIVAKALGGQRYPCPA